MESAIKGKCLIPLEAMVRFIRMAHIYEQKDVMEILGEKVIEATQLSSDPLMVARGKALQLMIAMELLVGAHKMISSAKQDVGGRRRQSAGAHGGRASAGRASVMTDYSAGAGASKMPGSPPPGGRGGRGGAAKGGKAGGKEASPQNEKGAGKGDRGSPQAGKGGGKADGGRGGPPKSGKKGEGGMGSPKGGSPKGGSPKGGSPKGGSPKGGSPKEGKESKKVSARKGAGEEEAGGEGGAGGEGSKVNSEELQTS